jgi:hypothetical protein
VPNHWASQGMDGRWLHRIEGEDQPAGVYENQREAWNAAKDAARRDRAEAFLQGENGRIRARNTYVRGPREIS